MFKAIFVFCRKISISVVFTLGLYSNSQALSFTLPPEGSNIVGSLQVVKLPPWEDLHSMGRKYDVGYDAMVAANPDVIPSKRIGWKQIIIPTTYILPPGPRKGIVINLPELRLYYYPPNTNTVQIFPVGIGQQGWSTPVGETSISDRVKNPTWHVPVSIAKALAAKGIYLPVKVESGPQDPLGYFALRLALPGYLIHGTNQPNSIGMRSSSGCIRMFPEDIENLFNGVATHTPVRIIDSPYKIGMKDGKMYLEAYKARAGADNTDDGINVSPLVKQILDHSEDINGNIDWKRVSRLTNSAKGIPEPISVGHV